MALFGTKKKVVDAKKEVEVKPIKSVKSNIPAVIPHAANTSATSVIIRPHVTEKSGLLSQNGVYTFQITTGANKDSVSKAIKNLYKVTPVKVGITTRPAKKVFVRGKKGSVPGIRKAVVTLKKGDKIDFV
jgi:large subunit ribosomal protein L23